MFKCIIEFFKSLWHKIFGSDTVNPDAQVVGGSPAKDETPVNEV